MYSVKNSWNKTEHATLIDKSEHFKYSFCVETKTNRLATVLNHGTPVARLSRSSVGVSSRNPLH